MLRSIVGPAARPVSEEQTGVSARLSCLLPECFGRNSATSLANDAAGPWGAREAVCAGCHATPQARKVGLPRIERSRSRTNRIDFAALRAATCAGGGATADSRDLLSTQIVRKPGESNFVRLRRRRTFDAKLSSTLAKSTKPDRSWQQRNLGEDRRDFRLRIHRGSQTCVDRGDECYSPVEIGCIPAGKGVPLQREWCGGKETFCAVSDTLPTINSRRRIVFGDCH